MKPQCDLPRTAIHCVLYIIRIGAERGGELWALDVSFILLRREL